MIDWQPTASIEMIHQRAKLLRQIRRFFDERGILEVETPLLCHTGNPDLNLDSFTCLSDTQAAGYLQTSPEFAMKRLLAAGIGPIYQLCKAFRAGEAGHRHNPEFTILEWYRPGFDHVMLMNEVEELLRFLELPGASAQFERIPYREAMQSYAGIDPNSDDIGSMLECCRQHDIVLSSDYQRDCKARPRQHGHEILDLLMGQVVEPALADRGFVFVTDYPAEQAALARINKENSDIADRFELFGMGMELANGFAELTDSVEQARRFTQQNQLRRQQGKPELAPDPRFLAALQAGLPDCAGVALGVDRLLMLLTSSDHIAKTLSFDSQHA